MALNSPLMVMQAFNSRKKKSRCDVMSFTTTQAFNHKSLQQTLPPLLSLSQHIGDLGRCQFSSWQRTAGHTASHLALFHIYLVKTYWLLLNRDEVVWNLKRKKKRLSLFMVLRNIAFISHQINLIKPTVTSLSTALTSEDFWCQKVVLEVLWHSRKQNTMLRSIVPK